MKKLSLIFIIGLLLISIMSFAGCGGDSGSINNVSEDSSSSIGTEESSSSSVTVTKESSSSGISSIGESSSSSSGVKQIPTSSSSSISSSSSSFVSDGTCDSLITPFTRTYSSFLLAYISDTSTTGVLSIKDRFVAEVTIEVRKDSTFFSTIVDNTEMTISYQNVSCETFDGELWVHSVKEYDERLFTSIFDLNGTWDMFSWVGKTYYVMGNSPYIDSSYWEQD